MHSHFNSNLRTLFVTSWEIFRMSEENNARTTAASAAATAADPALLQANSSNNIDSISERVKRSRRNPVYERSITDYFSKKRGPKTKFANKKKKGRIYYKKEKVTDNIDSIELSSSSSTNTEKVMMGMILIMLRKKVSIMEMI